MYFADLNADKINTYNYIDVYKKRENPKLKHFTIDQNVLVLICTHFNNNFVQ